MKYLQLVLQSIAHRGIRETIKKIHGRLAKGVSRMPIYITSAKLRLLVMISKRDKLRTTRLLGYRVTHKDIKSLYIEFKDIFKYQIYHFEPKSVVPTIIDGGGFIGLATLYFKKQFPAAHVIIFEPSPSALPQLQRNIEQNKLDNITIIQAGLGGREESVQFVPSETDAGKINPSGSVTVPVKPLSQYLNKSVDFLKLNIEGSELEVLRELDRAGCLDRVPELCFEWHSFASADQNLDECLTILRRRGYRYLINHFDYQTNRAVKPPFLVTEKTQFYLLVYARKIS